LNYITFAEAFDQDVFAAFQGLLDDGNLIFNDLYAFVSCKTVLLGGHFSHATARQSCLSISRVLFRSLDILFKDSIEFA
jgi:hypothetical protein